ncbi:MAG: MBL fold metallo-hydrolase [Opitutales bacterium]|nr:MBL fold metallo-hydrolase [Opitutales bacterium]
MNLTDLNRHGGIDANCLLLELGPFRIAVDAGLSPRVSGNRALPAFDHARDLPVDLILLTHCHLDHLGAMPVLMRQHPESTLVMSAPSKLLARRMLQNSYNVMIRQREDEGISEYPLFTRSEIERMGARVFPLGFNQPRIFSSASGETLVLTFHPAGHIPGAASVTLEYKHRRIFITGDVLFADQAILKGARLPRQRVDTLVLETTRGRTERPAGTSRDTEVERFLQHIRTVHARGGSLLVPAFALGRMQEILTLLHRAKLRGALPPVPVYASGLGLDLVNHFDEISRKTGGCDFRRQVVKDLGVLPLPDNGNGTKLPRHQAIYILSSGMMVAKTPSYNACASLLGNESNAVAFVGYCDPETPGGKLLASPAGAPFPFDSIDKRANRLASVERFDLSSHAERGELLDYAVSLDPRAIVLTHGDPDARQWFAAALAEALPKAAILDPEPLRVYEV